MKTKIVLWGENAANEPILLGIELVESENKILIHTIPQRVATEEFYKLMMDKWRNGEEVAFPEGSETIERSLKLTDSLLPDDIKVEKTEIIALAQAEWHVAVLSNKLYEAYKEEIDDIKGKIDVLSDFSEDAWSDLVQFWAKVSDQIKERTLFRDQASILKDRTDILFGKLKTLKKEAQKQFDEASKEVYASFEADLAAVSKKIEDGFALSPLFDELKAIQKKHQTAKLSRGDRNKVWSMIDETFKTLKAAKGAVSGGSREGGAKSPKQDGGLQKRYDGLLGAIRNLEYGIKRDHNEIAFQKNKINTTDGQLESQIRQAKLVMIEQQVHSKQEKLKELSEVKISLEGKLASIAERALTRQAKEKVEQKIAADIKSQKEELAPIAENLQAAAASIVESKQKSQKPVRPVEPLTAVVDTPELINDTVITQESKAAKEVNSEEESVVENIFNKIEGTVEDAVTTLKAVAEVAEDKLELLEEKIQDAINTFKEKSIDDSKEEE